MADSFKDVTNLKILKEICDGTGISINLSYLSKNLKKHRNTIKKKVEELIKSEIINLPYFPFFGQYKEYSLLIVVLADLPYTEEIRDWFKKSRYIFAAYKTRISKFNTLLLVFHKDILNYHLWRDSLVKRGKIPPRDIRTPSEASFYSNQLMVKYEPNEGIRILEEHMDSKKEITLNNLKITQLHFSILKLLLNGKGVRVNETILSKKLGMHKKTIRKRIQKMLKEKVILSPACRFPNFIVPPNFVLQVTKVEINKNKEEVLSFLRGDPHIPLAFHICEGRFNYLLFEIFFSAGDHVEWSSKIREKFKDSIGTSETILVTENNSIKIDRKKVGLNVINDCINSLEKHNKL